MGPRGNAPSHWIRSPLYDFLFFSTLWWIPLFVAVYATLPLALGGGLLFLAYHVFLRLPHFMATARVTYLRRENWEYYRDHWVTFFAVPVAILAVYATRGAFGPESAWSRVLSTVSLVWGLQHIAFQNYGVLGVYRGRTRAAPDPTTQRFEKTVFYSLLVASAFRSALSVWFDPRALVPVLRAGNRVLDLLVVAVVGAYLLRLYLRRRVQPVSVPGLLFFASAVASMIYWPVYNRLGPEGSGPTLYFYVFNGHHCLSYLGLLFLMDGNLRASREPARGFAGGPSQYARFLVPLIAVSAALMALGLKFGMGALTARLGATDFRALAPFEGFFVVHYFVESRSWKFQNPHHRKVTLPLLRQPAMASATLARAT